MASSCHPLFLLVSLFLFLSQPPGILRRSPPSARGYEAYLAQEAGKPIAIAGTSVRHWTWRSLKYMCFVPRHDDDHVRPAGRWGVVVVFDLFFLSWAMF